MIPLKCQGNRYTESVSLVAWSPELGFHVGAVAGNCGKGERRVQSAMTGL